MNGSNVTDTRINIKFLLWEKSAVNDFIIIGLYIPVILLALCTNLIFIVIVIKHRYLRRASSYFLVNLSVADLIVTVICMPSAMWKAYTIIYIFGKYSCKILTYIECVAVATSILTITTMAMHRYFAITKPLFGFRYRSYNRCGIIIVINCLWLISMVIFSPILWIYDLKITPFPIEDNFMFTFCVEDWTEVFISQRVMGILWFIFVFLLPGFIMLIAYSRMGQTLCSDAQFSENSAYTYQRGKLVRTRKKVACILLLLALIFAVCWLPLHIMNLIEDTRQLNASEESTKKKLHQNHIKRFLLWLGHLNSALNPLLYIFLSRKFRNCIKELFCRGSCEPQREFTRVTLIKLNTLRNHPLRNSPSISHTTRKVDGAGSNHNTTP